jgi:hypothetical protein
VESHLIDAVFHRSNAGCRRVPRGIHLVRQLLYQRLQLVELGVAVCSNARQWRLVQSLS